MTDSLQKKLMKELQGVDVDLAGKRLLVAVSGGGDSVALLHLLCRIQDALGFAIEAAHLDHGLRMESTEDAAFVVELCAEYGVPLTSDRIEVADRHTETGGNLEETAREIRRDFLRKVAQERACDLIALGHHLDDQAETFLQRLMRGAGTAGLSAMRRLDAPFFRPLLGIPRSELLEYLARNNLQWCEDESNRDTALTRNRIRHELLPQLQSFNPNIASRIAELSDRFALDEEYWTSLVAVEFDRIGATIDGGVTLGCAELQEMAPALSGRLIRYALERVRGDLRRISAQHITSTLSLVTSGAPQGEAHLPGVWVGRRYDQLLMLREPPGRDSFEKLTITGPGRYPLPDGQVLLVEMAAEAFGEDPTRVEFCADQVSFPLTLRRVQDGDRIRPKGMDGTKKLQDLFVDAKLTREERDRQLLVIAGQEVLWVVGLRRCAGRAPGTVGKQVLRMQITPAENETKHL